MKFQGRSCGRLSAAAAHLGQSRLPAWQAGLECCAMGDSFEDEYLDVLQNIEAVLAGVYRQDENLTDYDARTAVDALIRCYQAEMRGRPEPNIRMNDSARFAYAAVRSICEWRLGRESALEDEEGNEIQIPESEALTSEEIVACLKRIRRSIDLWNKELGRRGYFEFIKQFGI